MTLLSLVIFLFLFVSLESAMLPEKPPFIPKQPEGAPLSGSNRLRPGRTLREISGGSYVKTTRPVVLPVDSSYGSASASHINSDVDLSSEGTKLILPPIVSATSGIKEEFEPVHPVVIDPAEHVLPPIGPKLSDYRSIRKALVGFIVLFFFSIIFSVIGA